MFCLSISEAKQYFGNNKSRKCKMTAYARQRGAYVYNDCCYWWLRSPYNTGSKFGCSLLDRFQKDAAFVGTDGALILNIFGVSLDSIAVRPALRIICNK